MCLSSSTLAQRYVLFNPNCMERLKYDVINGYGGESYIIYAVELNDQEKVFLEIGKEEGKSLSRITRAVITCNSPSISKNMVNRINGNVGEKYAIVLKEGSGKFRVSDVKAASYYKQSDSGIEYIGKDYAFSYDSFRDTPSQNLASPNSGSRVFFVGNSRYECFEANTFSISTQSDSDVGLDLTIIPEVGVLEYRTNLSGGNGTKRLATVNAKTFRSIVQDRCQDRVSEPVATNRNNDVVTAPVTTTTPTSSEFTERSENRTPPVTTSTASVSKNASNSTPDYGIISRRIGTSASNNTIVYENGSNNRITANTDNSTSDIHTVAKGETLFRIAKKYGISVAQLQSFNDLRNNTIFPGDRLYVSAQSETLTERGNTRTVDMRDRNNTTSTANARDTNWPANTNPAWENTDGYHVFQRGESVAGIARLYGYTEERFRDLNTLRPNENVPVGYRLKTTDCDYQPPRNDSRTTTSDTFTGRSVNDDFNDGYDDEFVPSVRTPAPYGDDRYRRLDETRNSSNRDYRKAASPTTYSEGSALNIRFDRETQLHLVKENETLYSIARKYNTSVTKLADANNLDPREVLLPGQSIFIK